ncbi:hypothetical protein [Pseudovibrio sp. Ad26]|uniref:hypothetical protein n=1 Tax=Pseudovibrio sp. Ad26 TaxID=989410 RepID=UPI00128FE043|nr:hypothetical protein [Pseudovibrio sp. Ad26]
MGAISRDHKLIIKYYKAIPTFSTVSPQTLTATGTCSKLNLHKANSSEERLFRRKPQPLRKATTTNTLPMANYWLQQQRG